MDTIQIMADGSELTFTGIFVRVQNAGARKFNVRGAKANAVRELAIAGGMTRRQIADAASCSVSRVAEVLWGLDHDGIAYDVPAKAAAAPTQADADAALLADVAEL